MENKKLIATVQCDKCPWKKKKQNIFDWHNKKCPACQKEIIINDTDISVAEGLLALEKIKIISLDKKVIEKGGGIVMHLDTSPLRKKNCDNVDCKGNPKDIQEVKMKKEFEGGEVNWCKECRERDNNFIA